MSETPEPTPQPAAAAKKPSILEHPLAGKILAGLLFLSLSVLFLQWKADWFTGVIIEGEGKPRWIYLVPLSQAAVTAVAGVVAATLALWQFNRTHKQREDQHRDQQDTVRIQFDRKHLEDQFNDIQNRLSDENPAMRANAALRLAQLAETLRPGSETTDYTIENNPFFPRATSQLCIALNMEQHIGVRTAIVDALNNLNRFAADKPEEKLLDFLIHTLADANRTAHRNFLKALAAYWVAQPQAYSEKTWEQIGVAASFCEAELNRKVLEGQMQTKDFKDDCHILRELRRTVTDPTERKKSEATLLTQVQDCASRLKQTQGLLALCLKKREEFKEIDLQGTFLVGASLRLAQLQGANLYEAQLQGASLGGAQLQGANLSWAQLQGASLMGAQLQGASLMGAQLQKANLYKAQLQGADVGGSTLDEAKSVGDSWREANFRYENPQDSPLYKKLDEKFPKKEKEKKMEN